MSDALGLMRIASDEVLAEIIAYSFDRREGYNRALRLAMQVRHERCALAREVADAAIGENPVSVVADDNIEHEEH